MSLIHLNKLVEKNIHESGRTKTAMARKLRLKRQTFCYRLSRGLLDWEQVKRLRLDIDPKDLKRALERDLKV